jgi:hypothetical protein
MSDERALSKPPILPKVPTVEEPPQLDPTPPVELLDRPERSDQKLENRPEMDDSLRGKRGGEFKSPYMHHLRQDPSRQAREDTEQKDQIQELMQQRKEIDDQINEIRNQDTRINPYNVNQHVAETIAAIIADLRNMGQSPHSGDLSIQRGYSPLHTLFNDQFSVSEEEDEENELRASRS